jgi:hypothetical protein
MIPLALTAADFVAPAKRRPHHRTIIAKERWRDQTSAD